MDSFQALIPVFREVRGNRKRPPVLHYVFYLYSSDGVELHCKMIGDNPRKAVIVAHPAVVGSGYAQVMELSEGLSEHFSTVFFDFRGHGKSGGHCPLGFDKVSRDLEAVVEGVRKMGFEKVGVAGFSLGAAASFLLAARNDCIDSLAAIGCPPRLPEIDILERHPRIAGHVMRLLGMRLSLESDDGLSPIDVAMHLPRFPKFMIFGEWEIVPDDEIRVFVERTIGPKRYLTVPGTWHGDLGGREKMVSDWFRETLR